MLVGVLFCSSGVEPEIVAAAEVLDLAGGLRAPVATGGHLVAMKVLSEHNQRRPNDHDDILVLLREPETDIDQARALLRLMESRGHHRGKDLVARLSYFVGDAEIDKGSP